MSCAVVNNNTGKIADRRMARAFAQTRQFDKGGSGEASGSGGKSDDLVDKIVDQNSGDQMCQQPRSRQIGIGGGKLIDPAQGFEAFEADLHPPAVGMTINDLPRGMAADR